MPVLRLLYRYVEETGSPREPCAQASKSALKFFALIFSLTSANRNLFGQLVDAVADLDIDLWLSQQVMQFSAYHDSGALPPIDSDVDSDDESTSYPSWTQPNELNRSLAAQEGFSPSKIWGPAQGVVVCRPTGDTHPTLTPQRPSPLKSLVSIPSNESPTRSLRPGAHHRRPKPGISIQGVYLRRAPLRCQNGPLPQTKMVGDISRVPCPPGGEITPQRKPVMGIGQKPRRLPGNTNATAKETESMRQEKIAQSSQEFYPGVTIEFGDPYSWPSNPLRVSSHRSFSVLPPDLRKRIEHFSETVWSKIPLSLDDQSFEMDCQKNGGLVTMIDVSSSVTTIVEVSNVISGTLERHDHLKILIEVLRYCVVSVVKWIEVDPNLQSLVHVDEVSVRTQSQ